MPGLSRPRVDRQGVDIAAHQFSGGSIDHPVALHLRDALEGGGGNRDVKVSAFARTGMAGMPGTVVADLEQGRMQALQRRSQPLDARAHVGCSGLSFSSWPRISQNTMATLNRKSRGIESQDLKSTQAFSLML